MSGRKFPFGINLNVNAVISLSVQTSWKAFILLFITGSRSNFRILHTAAPLQTLKTFFFAALLSPLQPHHTAGWRAFCSFMQHVPEWKWQYGRFYFSFLRLLWVAAWDCWWTSSSIDTICPSFVLERFKQKILSGIISTEPSLQTGKSLTPGEATRCLMS